MATPGPGVTSSLPIEPLGGRYRVSGLTRSDQLGVVYQACDLSAGEAPRVVRVWSFSLAHDTEFRPQLRRRAARLTILAPQQSALPRVFSMEDTAEGDLLLVTDHVEGRSLGDLLSTAPPVEVRAALQLAVRLGEAIEAVHNAGLVHGYLAPAHVEICEPDQQIRLNGFEYGALRARVLGQLDLDAPPFSRDHRAPEQHEGQEITEAGDIYAYGCLLRDLMASVRLARRLPAGVNRALQAMLASNPADRPRAIGEALNDLWGELAEEPVAIAGRRALARRAGPAVVLATLVVAGASLWAVHKNGGKATAELAAQPRAVHESRPVNAASAAPPAMVQPVEPAEVPPPPQPPQPHGADERNASAAAPARVIEPEPPRPATIEKPGDRRAAGAQPRAQDPDTGVVRGQARPAAAVPETPRDTAANPRPTIPDRPPRREADDSDVPDPGGIIDWLLQDSRAGRL